MRPSSIPHRQLWKYCAQSGCTWRLFTSWMDAARLQQHTASYFIHCIHPCFFKAHLLEIALLPSLSLLACALLATTCPRRARVCAAEPGRQVSGGRVCFLLLGAHMWFPRLLCVSLSPHRPKPISHRQFCAKRSIATDYPEISTQMWKHSSPHSFPPLLTHSLTDITVVADEEVGKRLKFVCFPNK